VRRFQGDRPSNLDSVHSWQLRTWYLPSWRIPPGSVGSPTGFWSPAGYAIFIFHELRDAAAERTQIKNTLVSAPTWRMITADASTTASGP
jgi:hypothetical protein